MATFVMIHGARSGGWSWDRVRPFLEKAGHKVVTPDMPAHGDNRSADTSLQGFVDAILAAVDSQPEPVVLVGHSMAGMLISQAAEQRPEKIEKLVYVCAFLLRDGETLPSRGGGSFRPGNDAELKEFLFGSDCPEELFQWTKSRMVEPPRGVADKPIHVTTANYGKIPRYYIECLRDNAIKHHIQREMCADTPVVRVMTMDTGHMPLLTAPEELAKNLLSVLDD